MTKIGFLGPEGSFSHEAAVQLYGESLKPLLKRSFPEVFSALNEAHCAEIVVPIENSIEGLVTQVADLLVETRHIAITEEYILPIRQNMLAIPGTNSSGIQRVYSHPQALSQCSKFIERLRDNAGEIEEIFTKSTSEAAEIVTREKDMSNVAIGTKLSAVLNNLVVIFTDIADANNNQTRFLVLVRTAENHIPQLSGNDKTFIIFSVENKPGSLVRVLEVFDVLGVNMTLIESRPSKKRLGEYMFFVEFEGHIAHSNIAVALDRVRLRSTWLKILGSYPIYRQLESR